jgi:hypothetical protein
VFIGRHSERDRETPDSTPETSDTASRELFANWRKRLSALLSDGGDIDVAEAPRQSGGRIKSITRRKVKQTPVETFSSILNLTLAKFEPDYPPVPRVFVKMSKRASVAETLDQIAVLAICSLNGEALPNVITQTIINMKKDQSPENKFLGERLNEVMISHVIMFLAKQARNALVQIAELCNTLSYSRIELDAFGDNYPEIDSRAAVTIMSFLVAASDRDTKYHRQYANMMAQFLDTFAWTQYRKGMREIRTNDATGLTPVDIQIVLKRTEDVLHQAIRYDPTRAIIHHHLSILYLTRVEFKWLERMQPHYEMSERDASVIDINLKQALRAWHEASRHDVSHRLHKRLARQYHRVLEFEQAWGEEKFELHKNAGSPD